MSTELKDTIEAIGKAFEEFKAENDKKLKELSTSKDDPILTEKIDKINAEMTDLKNLKFEIENLEKVVGRIGAPDGGGATSNGVKAEHAKAFDAWFRKGGDDRFEAVRKLQVEAGLSTLSDPDGGYIVAPPEFDKAIERVAGTISVMRQLATVRTIGVNEYKKIVNTGGTSSGWVAEKESRSETDTPTLKQITINMKEIYAEPGCTQMSLDDSYMDLAKWLADEVSVEFNEQEGSAFITGDGVAKPTGIAGYDFVANSSYAWGKVGYVAGGHATLLNNADKLIGLQHALKSTYRNGATFLMNDATCEKIRTLKDGDGNYIWRPGLMENTPDMLLGKPVAYDDNVADIGAGAYPLFFGNFKRAYLILDRMGIRVLRDPYSSKGNVLFYTTRRVGGGLILHEAIKALRIATS